MKTLSIISCLIFISCAHDRRPASLDGNAVAYNSAALGNIKAQATKITEKQDVCFDIKLDMTGVKQQEALASNWSVSWVDQKNQSHPLSITTRGPASVPKGGHVLAPYGTYEQWTNSFYACTDSAHASDVKALVLTPKQTSYQDKEIMLNW